MCDHCMSALTSVLFSPLPVNERSEAKLGEITDQSVVTSAEASRRTGTVKSIYSSESSLSWPFSNVGHTLCGPASRASQCPTERSQPPPVADGRIAAFSPIPSQLQAVIQHWHFSTNQYLIIGSNRARSNPPEIAGAQSAQMSLCLCVRTRIISSAAIIERAFTCQIVY